MTVPSSYGAQPCLRCLILTRVSFTAEQAERWGAVAEVVPLEQARPSPEGLTAADLAQQQH
ncbi:MULTISPECIES: hypothetical protein [unclassified Streptomyces]|uniref:hypothetical protein n=1 Tax=unclassified Streptomyces TaxID=2593676 RepID=UPI000749E4AA|nr:MULTISPECIES: hypothetical protein [unclassified Streptomyces]KUL75463.1 hypothetical protein ADL34_14905 [Streptomyces sp. NRRL WC-3605]KUL76027.1 hypothetical protein ADL33_14015 [Streptomyces sp. NRRL WC-3604]